MAIGISTLAHIILVVASIPSVLRNQSGAFGCFIVGLLILCTGTGFFKANISPLLAEQNRDTRMRVIELKGGERVIVDPAVTNTRIFLYFYFAINIGSVCGQISMVYVEKFIGFWLAFLLPTILVREPVLILDHVHTIIASLQCLLVFLSLIPSLHSSPEKLLVLLIVSQHDQVRLVNLGQSHLGILKVSSRRDNAIVNIV